MMSNSLTGMTVPEIDMDSFLEAIQNASTIKALWKICAERLNQHGFGHITYLLMRPNAAHDNPIALTTMPSWWADTYLDPAHVGGDPLFRFCGNFKPRKTGSDYLDRYPPLTPTERERVLLAGEAGCRSGFSSPVRLLGNRRCGGWNFGSSMGRAEFDQLYPRLRAQVQLIGFYAHERIEALHEQPDTLAAQESFLSPREQECLAFLARGSRTSRIADALSISGATVEFHLKNARRKLGASTREEALAKAITLRQISVG